MGKGVCQLTTRIVVILLSIVVLILSILSISKPLFTMTVVMTSFENETRVKEFSYGTSCHENDYHCDIVETIFALAFSITATCLAVVAIILMIPLLAIQISWNCGGFRGVDRERGVAIAHLVFVILYFCLILVSFALSVTGLQRLRSMNSVGTRYGNGDVVLSNAVGPAFYLSLFAFLAALVSFILSAIPALFGVEYLCPCCPGYTSANDKAERLRRTIESVRPSTSGHLANVLAAGERRPSFEPYKVELPQKVTSSQNIADGSA